MQKRRPTIVGKLSVIGRLAIFPSRSQSRKLAISSWQPSIFLPTALCRLPTDREPSNTSNISILYPIRYLRFKLTLGKTRLEKIGADPSKVAPMVLMMDVNPGRTSLIAH